MHHRNAFVWTFVPGLVVLLIGCSGSQDLAGKEKKKPGKESGDQIRSGDPTQEGEIGDTHDEAADESEAGPEDPVDPEEPDGPEDPAKRIPDDEKPKDPVKVSPELANCLDSDFTYLQHAMDKNYCMYVAPELLSLVGDPTLNLLNLPAKVLVNHKSPMTLFAPQPTGLKADIGKLEASFSCAEKTKKALSDIWLFVDCEKELLHVSEVSYDMALIAAAAAPGDALAKILLALSVNFGERKWVSHPLKSVNVGKSNALQRFCKRSVPGPEVACPSPYLSVEDLLKLEGIL